ncbi:hypothetical protein G6O69_25115 [Pseudenhygromyxa sp. WMMC2535]|uniref:hypothetical protein n=1 Tax=Pseudenhygromyxa sp. WMMC2535 TaxID=2712867 RepID=UPI0015532043|nr:hypothetical protein [Pseudenhygromyxa sp. WMMC2535]NVB41145.1 hypothetical protein [Pseudenhygromyxa sp. WMMC2535]
MDGFAGRELVGAIALGFFWIHTLLIAGAAVLDLRDLRALARRLRPLELREGARGMILAQAQGRGPEGALARNEVEQIGRSKGDGRVHFSDAAHRSEIFGGQVEHAGARVEIAAASEDAASVWPASDARARAAAPEGPEQVAAVIPAAKRGRGWPRQVGVSVGTDAPVWIAGRLERGGDTQWRLVGEAGAPLLVSAIDPRAWIRRKRALAVAFIVIEILLAAACSTAILWPPRFDWVSILGAAGALGFFLGVQPIGVAVTDALRTPDRAYLRGTWRA